MDRLVQKLSTGKHTVLFEPRTEELSEIEERLNQGFVFLKFSETNGGTELGINVDSQLTNFKQVDFKTGKGIIQLAGTCELNFQKVRCLAEIDLMTRQGIGSLELLDGEHGQPISNGIQ